MRMAMVTTALCLCLVGISAAAAADASVRKATDIPAQGLRPALHQLSRDRDIQVVFRTDVVGKIRTPGASGDLTLPEALTQLLSGTGLTYQYLDDKTVTIVPIAPGPSVPTPSMAPASDTPPPSGADPRRQSARGPLRLAQADQGATGGSAAVTQDSEPRSQSRPDQIEEVVVTAERREERAIDVPVSLTALSTAQLEQRQIKDLSALFGAVPNLSIAPGLGERHGLFIGLRGLSAQASSIGADPAVGVYVDGLYLARTTGVDVAMVDMERLEVLRGPQGTLFGRNTIGGALNITTVKPSDQFGGEAKIEVGNYNTIEETAILNLPLTEQLSTRFVYRGERDRGYAYDTFLGQHMSNDNYDYARASIRYNPGSIFEAIVTADYFNSDTHSVLYKLATFRASSGAQRIALANGDTLANYLGGNFYQNQADFNPTVAQHFFSVVGTLTAALDWVTLKSITGYRNIVSNRGTDADGTPYAIFEYGNAGSPQHQFSEEVQAYGKAFDDHLDWIVGGYSFQEYGANTASTYQNFSPLNPPVNANVVHVDLLDAKNTSNSVFGQLSYEFLPGLQAIGGARYVEDTRRAVDSFRLVNANTGAVNCLLPHTGANSLPGFDAATCTAPTQPVTFHYVPWTAGLEYKLNPDTMTYAKATRGYRSGGYPSPSFTNAAQYAPFGTESTLTYEMGTKLLLADKRVSLNLAGYHTDYANIQQTVTSAGVGGLLVQVIQNVGSAGIWGGEAEAGLSIGKLRLNLGLGYVDPHYTSGPLVGLKFINTSRVTSSIAADYPVEVGVGELDLHADYDWRSTIRFFSSSGLTASEIAATQQGDVGLLNASLSLVRDHMTLSVWGRNLTDERYLRGAVNFAASAGVVADAPAQPLTFGASAAYKF